MKYSKVAGIVRWSGGTTVLGVGTSADADHPLVVERPDLFGDEGPAPQLSGPGRAAARSAADEAPVERATRAPGEMRPAVKKAAPAKKATGGADNG